MFSFAYLVFAILGVVVGSFSVAQVWRIRSSELNDAKKSGQKIDEKEWAKLNTLVNSKFSKDRSRCLSCGYQLKWFDLIPVFSWISLGGKCRKCREPIGWIEILAEIFTGIIFSIVLGNYFNSLNSDLGLLSLAALFVALSCLVILFIYDAKWSLLPTNILWIFNLFATIFFMANFVAKGFSLEGILNLLIALSVFPLLYYVLSKISNGAWVGDGDWILALGLVLLLPNSPVFAVLLLLFSNLTGLAIIFFMAVFQKNKIKKGAQIPFGPAMIFANLILMIFANFFDNFVIFLS